MKYLDDSTKESIMEAFLAEWGPDNGFYPYGTEVEVEKFRRAWDLPPLFSSRYLKDKLQRWAQTQYDTAPVLDPTYFTPEHWSRIEILIHFGTFAHLVGWPTDLSGYPCVALPDQLIDGAYETVTVPVRPLFQDVPPGGFLLPDDDLGMLPPFGLEPWREELYLSMREKGSSHEEVIHLFKDEDKLKDIPAAGKGVSLF